MENMPKRPRSLLLVPDFNFKLKLRKRAATDGHHRPLPIIDVRRYSLHSSGKLYLFYSK